MLGSKYNFEFTDIDKLQEIVTEKHKKYNYLYDSWNIYVYVCRFIWRFFRLWI